MIFALEVSLLRDVSRNIDMFALEASLLHDVSRNIAVFAVEASLLHDVSRNIAIFALEASLLHDVTRNIAIFAPEASLLHDVALRIATCRIRRCPPGTARPRCARCCRYHPDHAALVWVTSGFRIMCAVWAAPAFALAARHEALCIAGAD